MMTICENCYKINTIDSDNKCCSCGHINKNIIEVDELIANVISILNKNGIKTKYSCQGHIFNDQYIFPYIMFLYDTNYRVFTDILDKLNLEYQEIQLPLGVSVHIIPKTISLGIVDGAHIRLLYRTEILHIWNDIEKELYYKFDKNG